MSHPLKQFPEQCGLSLMLTTITTVLTTTRKVVDNSDVENNDVDSNDIDVGSLLSATGFSLYALLSWKPHRGPPSTRFCVSFQRYKCISVYFYVYCIQFFYFWARHYMFVSVYTYHSNTLHLDYHPNSHFNNSENLELYNMYMCWALSY